MEVTIAKTHSTSFGFVKLKKDKAKFGRILISLKTQLKRQNPSLMLRQFELQESQNWKRRAACISRMKQGGIPR